MDDIKHLIFAMVIGSIIITSFVAIFIDTSARNNVNITDPNINELSRQSNITLEINNKNSVYAISNNMMSKVTSNQSSVTNVDPLSFIGGSAASALTYTTSIIPIVGGVLQATAGYLHLPSWLIMAIMTLVILLVVFGLIYAFIIRA